MDQVDKIEYPRQYDFIDEATGLIQPWEALESMGVENIGHGILRWAHGQNNSVLNTGFCAWHRVLGFKRESLDGGEAIEFYTHGDFGHKSGGSSMIHRFAKVIRFVDDPKVLRVRFMMTRDYNNSADAPKPYLIAMLDRDYPEFRVPLYVESRDSAIAVDLANHILSGTFLFTDEEPTHPTEPPLTAGFRYQTFTSIIPAQQPMSE
jgi:hypothetical protein